MTEPTLTEAERGLLLRAWPWPEEAATTPDGLAAVVGVVEELLAARLAPIEAEVAALRQQVADLTTERDILASDTLVTRLEAKAAAQAEVIDRVRALHRPDGGIGGPGAMCVECSRDFGTPAEDPVAWPCATVAALATPDAEEIEDGFGGHWTTCGPGCDLQVVRPGKVQCNWAATTCPDRPTPSTTDTQEATPDE